MIKIDKTDKKILLELYKNGRINYSELSKKLKTSKEVINYRIKKLTEKQIILKTIPIINYSKLGYNIYRLQIKFTNISKEKKTELIKKFEKLPNISWIVSLEGNCDRVLLF